MEIELMGNSEGIFSLKEKLKSENVNYDLKLLESAEVTKITCGVIIDLLKIGIPLLAQKIYSVLKERKDAKFRLSINGKLITIEDSQKRIEDKLEEALKKINEE